jgi:hypothetical protein
MPKSVDEVLSKLSVGAHDTDAYPPGTFALPVTANGVTAYLANATGAFDTNTVFEVTDDNGRLHRLKNTRSMVAIQGGNTYSFRNPPSFMSVLNTEVSSAGYIFLSSLFFRMSQIMIFYARMNIPPSLNKILAGQSKRSLLRDGGRTSELALYIYFHHQFVNRMCQFTHILTMMSDAYIYPPLLLTQHLLGSLLLP